jgi:hypothetical protein
MTHMDTVSQLQAMGLTLPSPAYIFGVLLFSLLGMAAWMVGKRKQKATTKWLGVALMFYPYAVSQTALLYLVGVALCGAIVWDARRDGA